jgi:hypothetical protein
MGAWADIIKVLIGWLPDLIKMIVDLITKYKKPEPGVGKASFADDHADDICEGLTKVQLALEDAKCRLTALKAPKEVV